MQLLENHTLHSGTYLYGPYMAVPFPGYKTYRNNSLKERFLSGYFCHVSWCTAAVSEECCPNQVLTKLLFFIEWLQLSSRRKIRQFKNDKRYNNY